MKNAMKVALAAVAVVIAGPAGAGDSYTYQPLNPAETAHIARMNQIRDASRDMKGLAAHGPYPSMAGCKYENYKGTGADGQGTTMTVIKDC
jgi:hypothetical protein